MNDPKSTKGICSAKETILQSLTPLVVDIKGRSASGPLIGLRPEGHTGESRHATTGTARTLLTVPHGAVLFEA